MVEGRGEGEREDWGGEVRGKGEGGYGRRGGGGREVVPGLSDDDIVEGLMSLAEAGEADLEDHIMGVDSLLCNSFVELFVEVDTILTLATRHLKDDSMTWDFGCKAGTRLCFRRSWAVR